MIENKQQGPILITSFSGVLSDTGSRREQQKRPSFPGEALGRMGVVPCLLLFERCDCYEIYI